MNLTETLIKQLAGQRATGAELSRALWAMSPAERDAAMRRGDLTGSQLIEWARRAPEEVPTINGEWALIAASTPELADVEDTGK